MLRRTSLALIAALLLAGVGATARADTPDGTVAIQTPYAYAVLLQRLDQAIEANGLLVVARASASIGAAQRGLTIAGNAVVMAFRNDYAVRLLAADPAAGIEAPIRFYVTESADGTAQLAYRKPTALFAPYHQPAVDRLAAELDGIFAKIAHDAAAP